MFPRMRQLWSLETRGACHKPQEEERELGTFPPVILIQQGAEMGLKGNNGESLFPPPKSFKNLLPVSQSQLSGDDSQHSLYTFTTPGRIQVLYSKKKKKKKKKSNRAAIVGNQGPKTGMEG